MSILADSAIDYHWLKWAPGPRTLGKGVGKGEEKWMKWRAHFCAMDGIENGRSDTVWSTNILESWNLKPEVAGLFSACAPLVEMHVMMVFDIPCQSVNPTVHGTVYQPTSPVSLTIRWDMNCHTFMFDTIHRNAKPKALREAQWRDRFQSPFRSSWSTLSRPSPAAVPTSNPWAIFPDWEF